MQIFGTPIPVRFIHLTLMDWIGQALLPERKEHSEAKFIFVYFSYQPDFEYLRLSLSSLVQNIEDNYIREVHLFEDQKAKFNDSELTSLKDLCPKLIVHPVENFSWASPESTFAEIKCFIKAGMSANDRDMIVKVDSDILFLPSKKLLRLLKSRLDAVGDGHHEYYKFAQGGLYMLRHSLIRNILAKVNLQDVLKAAEKNKSAGEDKAISQILRNHNYGFHLTRLMLFPTEYRRMNKLTSFNKWDFCAAHFVKDKQKMARYNKIFNC